MNAFVRHHQPAVTLAYSCFDRVLLNGYVRALFGGGSIVHFLRHRRGAGLVGPDYLRYLSSAYHRSVAAQAEAAGLAIVTPPPDVRRHEWVEPYYRDLGDRSGVAVILKCRERARVATCFPTRAYRIEPAWRYVNLYYFYLRDADLGRCFLRVCPYFPFDIQVCLNGHEWLACQLRRAGIGFTQRDNAFVACDAAARLQALADAFGADAISAAVEPWVARWVPYFTPAERADGYRHRLFVAQVEYCHNLIFARAAALDRLFGRLVDSNRAIGTPQKLATIFGRARFQPDTRTAQREVKVTALKTTVVRAGFGATSVKQYVKSGVLLRTETSCHQLRELAIPKDVQNLPRVRAVLDGSNDRYLRAQQDVLASFIDRGQLERLRQPTVSATGRRTPGVRLDDVRLLAVLHALTCFAHLIKGCFRTTDLLGDVQRALGNAAYRLTQLRYDLGKLRGKGLVQRVPGTQRYELADEGYRLAVLYQKLYDRVYAPLTAATLDPVATDNLVAGSCKTKLDRLYEAVDKALRQLSEGVGLVA